MAIPTQPQQAKGADRTSRPGSPWSVLIGLGIPAAAIILVLPVISGVQASVAGLPLVYFWIFLWFPLTFACLAISWYGFDRRRYAAAEREEDHD